MLRGDRHDCRERGIAPARNQQCGEDGQSGILTRIDKMDFHRRIFARDGVLAGGVEVKLSERKNRLTDRDGASGGGTDLERVTVVPDSQAILGQFDAEFGQDRPDAVPQIDGGLLISRAARAERRVEACPLCRAVFAIVPFLSGQYGSAKRTSEES